VVVDQNADDRPGRGARRGVAGKGLFAFFYSDSSPTRDAPLLNLISDGHQEASGGLVRSVISGRFSFDPPDYVRFPHAQTLAGIQSYQPCEMTRKDSKQAPRKGPPGGVLGGEALANRAGRDTRPTIPGVDQTARWITNLPPWTSRELTLRRGRTALRVCDYEAGREKSSFTGKKHAAEPGFGNLTSGALGNRSGRGEPGASLGTVGAWWRSVRSCT